MKQQETISDRIKILIDEKADGNLSEFARLTGIDKATLSRVLSGKRELLLHHMQTIERKTRARLLWIRTGILPHYHAAEWQPNYDEDLTEGRQLELYLRENGITWVSLANVMGKTKATVTQYQKSANFRSDIKLEILGGLSALLEREVRSEDIFSPNMKSNANRPILVDSIDAADTVPILRVPVRARAGFGYVSYFNGPENERSYVAVSKDRLYQNTKITIRGDKVTLDPEHCIVEVNGDSMEPALLSGFELLAYKMEQGGIPRLGSIVVVDYRDEFLVKRLSGVNHSTNTITLKSDNGGAEMVLPFDDVRSVYRVYDIFKARL